MSTSTHPLQQISPDDRQAHLRAILEAHGAAVARQQAIAYAEADRADYPQYGPAFFEGWDLAVAKGDYVTKGGVAMEQGDLVLVKRDPQPIDSRSRRDSVILSSRRPHAVALNYDGQVRRIAWTVTLPQRVAR